MLRGCNAARNRRRTCFAQTGVAAAVSGGSLSTLPLRTAAATTPSLCYNWLVPVQLPLDHLPALWPEKLRGARIGALLHPASVSSNLEHASRILERVNGDLLKIAAFFGPQHGFLGQTQDNMVEWKSYEHPRLGIPVYSLYGDHREPTAEMLQDLDVLLVDLQDVGARYYTFIWTLYLCMRACEKHGVHVVVLDRPNPINGVTIEGPIIESGYESFVGMHPIPVRHGRTIGELAQQFRDEAFPKCRLSILPMKNWERAMWFDQTGLPWVMPSPNMSTIDTATVYPGMCLLEATNISEGRGTTRPFEIFGAPFIDAETLCGELNNLKLPGVFFRENYFQPTFQKFAGQLCGGAQLHVFDRDKFRSFQTGVEIIRSIRKLYPNSFEWKQPPYEYEREKLPIQILLGGPATDFFGD
jgi:uncharacterized protein YbbC (DUF1343 family)